MVLRRALVLANLLAVAQASALHAASLQGHVDVRLEAHAAAERPNPAALGAGAALTPPDRRTSVVYLEVAPRAAFESLERPAAVLDQRDQAFVPFVLAITVGTSVSFPNSDNTFHNVFSLSKARRFDLGRYPRGQARSVRFERPGIVRVFCDIHANMNAFILVFAHPYFATTDLSGRYRIERVPPGEYSLSVWTDGRVRETRRVSVSDPNALVETDFVVR